MNLSEVLPYIAGPYGGLFIALGVVWFLYRELKAERKENRQLRNEISRQFEERLNDAKGQEMLARAYLKLREQERT